MWATAQTNQVVVYGMSVCQRGIIEWECLRGFRGVRATPCGDSWSQMSILSPAVLQQGFPAYHTPGQMQTDNWSSSECVFIFGGHGHVS